MHLLMRINAPTWRAVIQVPRNSTSIARLYQLFLLQILDIFYSTHVMPWRKPLSLLLMMSIDSAFGATSISSHQPGTSNAFGSTNASHHRPGTLAKSMTSSGEVALHFSGIGHHLMSTNGSSYQDGSVTGSLMGSINYATKQETQM